MIRKIQSNLGECKNNGEAWVKNMCCSQLGYI